MTQSTYNKVNLIYILGYPKIWCGEHAPQYNITCMPYHDMQLNL